MKKSKNKQKYYYRTEVTECVLCGREKKSRERVNEKEKSGTKYNQDACPQHFI